MLRGVLITLCIGFSLLANPAFAQLEILTPIQTPKILISPQFPAPGDRITVTLDDRSGIVDQSTITWKLGTSTLTDVTNSRSISFTAGEAMRGQTISVTLEPRSGQPVTIRETVTPRYLDIIVEPQTYVPPDYPGRPLPTYGSLVRVTAVLNGSNTIENPDNFNYLWKLNNSVIGGGLKRSGDQITYTVPHGRSHTISVEITDQSGKTIARRGVTVPVREVAVRLFETSPLYGITNITTNPIRMIGTSLTLRAVPYYIDTRALIGNLYTQWEIDGRKVSTGDSPFELTIERRGQGQGNLEFEVRNLDELLQGGKVNTTITF